MKPPYFITFSGRSIVCYGCVNITRWLIASLWLAVYRQSFSAQSPLRLTTSYVLKSKSKLLYDWQFKTPLSTVLLLLAFPLKH
jgi:hypothetical protein